jgi:hypothetical protein
LCGKNSNRARLVESEVDVRIDCECGWTTGHYCVGYITSAARRANDLEPVACTLTGSLNVIERFELSARWSRRL